MISKKQLADEMFNLGPPFLLNDVDMMGKLKTEVILGHIDMMSKPFVLCPL